MLRGRFEGANIRQ